MWEDIAAALRRGINDGTYPPGSLLPSIAQIQAEYGVSDTPVRRALAVLSGEGLVVAEHGRGVRVTSATPVTPGMEERVTALEVWALEHAADGHTHG